MNGTYHATSWKNGATSPVDRDTRRKCSSASAVSSDGSVIIGESNTVGGSYFAVSLGNGATTLTSLETLGVQSRVKWTASMGSDLAVGTRRADSFLRCKAMKGLEPRGEVVSFDEGGKVIFKLSVGLIVILPDVCLLQGPVHPFDLAVARWVVGLGETVIDAVSPAGSVDGVAAPARGSSHPGSWAGRRIGCRCR